MTFVVWLHVFAAIFLIGPLTVAMSAAPSAIKAGEESLSLLRWLHRTTRYYGLGTLLVLATGAWVVGVSKEVAFDSAWLSVSMALFILGFLMVLFSAHEQRKAIATIEAGDDASVAGGRLSAIAGFTALLWVVILLLMVFHPGTK
jgi:uncharacterized membrane protein